MDPSKGLGIFHTRYSSGENSITVVIKGGGSFSLSDLGGNGHFALANDGATRSVSSGVIELDPPGQVRGSYYRDAGANISLTGGSISITMTRVLPGTINAADGTTFTISYGKMNLSKSIISLVGPTSAGGRDFIIALKEG